MGLRLLEHKTCATYCGIVDMCFQLFRFNNDQAEDELMPYISDIFLREIPFFELFHPRESISFASFSDSFALWCFSPWSIRPIFEVCF